MSAPAVAAPGQSLGFAIVGYCRQNQNGTTTCVQGLPAISDEAAIASWGDRKERPDERPEMSRRWLREHFSRLTPSLRRRLAFLINQRYRTCQAAARSLPRNCFEAAAYMSDLNFLSRRTSDCGGQKTLDDKNLLDLLMMRGYRSLYAFQPFETIKLSGDKVISKVVMSAIPELHPGDILFFGADPVEKGNKYLHAAVYLGVFAGERYLFEKPSFDCGKSSPYQVISLEAKLKQNRGNPDSCDHCYDSVFVYRQAK
jgi:hypothetical protein